MLNPIVRCKVIRARNAYLKSEGFSSGMTKNRLLDIAGDRYDIYRSEGRPIDAGRVLRLATTKKGADAEGMKRLAGIRKDILE